MSVVIGIVDKENKRVIMGCDSQATTGYGKNTITNKNNFKIFKPKEEGVLIGVCGYLRDVNLLYCTKDYLDELSKLKNEINFEYIVTKVVPKIFDVLETNRRISKDSKDGTFLIESQILFAYKNKLFNIGVDGSVMEIDDYCAIGSGASNSIGYLNESTEDNIYTKVEKAVSSACKSDLYVGKPIIIMNTQNNDIKIIKD